MLQHGFEMEKKNTSLADIIWKVPNPPMDNFKDQLTRVKNTSFKIIKDGRLVDEL